MIWTPQWRPRAPAGLPSRASLESRERDEAARESWEQWASMGGTVEPSWIAGARLGDALAYRSRLGSALWRGTAPVMLTEIRSPAV